MSKIREKTSGLPAPSKRVKRKYLSRAEREARMNRIVLIVSGVLAVALILILGGAVFIDGVLRPNQAVASAGNQNISARDFQKRATFERWRTGLQLAQYYQMFGEQIFSSQSQFSQIYQGLQVPSYGAQQTLSDMLDSLVIQEYASEHNITVSDQEVDDQVYKFFQFQPTEMTETPTLTPTITLTPLVSATPSPLPSATVIPMMTSMPASTSTPGPVVVTTKTDKFEVRNGPGKDYAVIGTLQAKTQIQVSGRSKDGQWYVIPYGGGFGWIAADPQGIDITGDPAVLNIYLPMPTPTPAPPTATPFPTGVPTATPGATKRYEDFQQSSKNYYDQAAKATGLSESDIRQIFKEQVLHDKVMKAVVGDPPKKQDQLKVRHILLSTQAQAQDVLKALQNGEPFAALARAVSTDTGSKDNGGELGWAGKGAYVPEFEDAIWKAKVGEIIGPIDTTKNGSQYGFHIIQVEAHEERDLTDTQGTDAQTKAFQDWLTTERNNRNAKTYDSWTDFVPTTPSLTDMGLPEALSGQQ